VMWIPVYQKLERAGLEAVLVNTKGLKHVPGRKSDVLDCQWLQQLHSYGLLGGSFRPSDLICQLRTLMRHRQNLVHGMGRETQHMQKAMQEMGLHLHVVLSDVCGETGLRIIDAILEGQRDPKALVALRDGRVKKSTPAQMEAALQGNWRPELLFVLEQSRRAYQFLQQQIEELDVRIVALLQEIPPAPVVIPKPQPLADQPSQARPKKRKRISPSGHPLAVDVRDQLHTIMGADLTLIPGLNAVAVLVNPLGNRNQPAALAQCGSLRGMAGPGARKQNQRRQGPEQQNPARDEPGGGAAASGGIGGGPHRELSGTVPSAH